MASTIALVGVSILSSSFENVITVVWTESSKVRSSKAVKAISAVPPEPESIVTPAEELTSTSPADVSIKSPDEIVERVRLPEDALKLLAPVPSIEKAPVYSMS